MKYYQFYLEEMKVLRALEIAFKELKHNLYEFFLLGGNDSTPEHWELPPQGRITIKSEINPYVEKHQDFIKMSLRLGNQKDKVDFLYSIIDSLKSRGFNIKAAMEHERFKQGS
jgi:hypothetical protein